MKGDRFVISFLAMTGELMEDVMVSVAKLESPRLSWSHPNYFPVV